MSAPLYNKLTVTDFLTRFQLVDGCGITLACNVGTMPFSPDFSSTLPDAYLGGMPNLRRMYPTTLYLSPRTQGFTPGPTSAHVGEGAQSQSSNTTLSYGGNPSMTNNVTSVDPTFDDGIARPATAGYTTYTGVVRAQRYNDSLYPDFRMAQSNANATEVSGYLPVDGAGNPSPNATQVLYLQLIQDGDDVYLAFRGPKYEYLNMVSSSQISTALPASSPVFVLAWQPSQPSFYSAHWIP